MLRFEKKTEYDYSLEAKELARDAGLSVRTAQLLMLRGIVTAREAESFMHPLKFEFHDPFLFNEMKAAVACIKSAIESNSKICVFGDYDVDGVCATAIMVKTLKNLNADVIYYIPSRHDEGYGLTVKSIDEIAKNGTRLIVTVDNGVKALNEAEYCKAIGVKLVVTDHHICDDVLPVCDALICHTIPHCEYPNKNICGAGTALKLCQALLGDEALKYGLELSGIATVADIVPLIGENKAFVAQALKQINSGNASLGISTLLNHASKKRRLVTAYDFGFVIGPRLNAAGRIEAADLAVKLLLTDDKAEAVKLSEKLDELNWQRRQEEEGIYNDVADALESIDLAEKRTIVLKSEKWNPGVIGVAASKVAERYMRPTILFTERNSILTGSGRSIRGVSLYDGLNANSELFLRFGGHSYAAGITMQLDNYESFCERFEESIETISHESDFIPRQTFELELDIGELNRRFAEELELMAPFGEGNPAPLFLLRDAMLKKFKVYGSDTTHLSMSIQKNNIYQDAFYPFVGDKVKELLNYGFCDIVYSYEINRFLDKSSPRMLIKSIKRADAGEPAEYAANSRTKFLGAICRNIRYNSNRICYDVEYIDADKRASSLFQNRISGTVVLVLTVEGAKRFLMFAEKHALFNCFDLVFYHNKHDVCAYNTVVFAPILDELELDRFKNIIVYDTSMSLGLLDELCSLAPKAQVEVSNNDLNYEQTELGAVELNRDIIKVVYLALRKRGGSFYNKSSLIDDLRIDTKLPDYVLELAIDVFIELGFLFVEGKTLSYIQNVPFKNLSESPTYQAASNLEEMYRANMHTRRKK